MINFSSLMGVLLASIIFSSSPAYGINLDGAEHYTLPQNRFKKLPFSEAVRTGDTVYLAGQIGIPPGESALVSGGIANETEQTLTNIRLVLQHFGLTMGDIVRCQVMLANISEWPNFNKVYQQFFSAPYPARSAFAANGLAFDARVEVECVAQMRTMDACTKEAKYCSSSSECCANLSCKPGGSRAGTLKCLAD